MAYTLWKVLGGNHQVLGEFDKPLEQVAPLVMLMAVQASKTLNPDTPVGEIYAQGAGSPDGTREGVIVGVVVQHGGNKDPDYLDLFVVEPCTKEEWLAAVGQPVDRVERDKHPDRGIGELDE